MSIPKEPRQQMINMMYLVLTALLALNVSAEILKAFALVNESLEKSADIIVEKNELMMKQFERKMADDPGKTKPYFDKAQKVQQYCNEFNKYLEEIKNLVIDRGGNKNGKVDEGDFLELEEGEPRRWEGESNLEVITWALLEEEGGKRGIEFKKKIIETREKLLELVDTADRYKIKLSLTLPADSKTVGGEKKDWQFSIFHMVPLAAGITLFSKFQSDIKNSESEILAYLLGRISSDDFTFDKLEARVVPSSRNIMIGEEFKAEIFVAASSSTLNPSIFIGKLDSSDNLVEVRDSLQVEGGKGIYTAKPSSEGPQNFEGSIKVKKPNGTIQSFSFREEYLSYKGGIVVSPDKMNVFYLGLDNPVSISVPGVAPEDVTASMTNGNISGAKGKYMVRPTATGKATITVAIKKKEGGGSKQMGSSDFRVRRVPPPVPKIGGQSGGTIKSSTFKAQTGMIADLEDFLFEGVRFNVVEYEMLYIPLRQEGISAKTTGPLFDSKMQSYVQKAKPGDVFYFSNIKARGPDGTTVKLPDIIFKMN